MMSFEPSFVANISKRGLKEHNSYDPNANGVLLILAQHAKTKIEVSTNLSRWYIQHHLVRNSKTTSCVDWRIKYKMICSAKTVGQCCLCMTCQTQIVSSPQKKHSWMKLRMMDLVSVSNRSWNWEFVVGEKYILDLWVTVLGRKTKRIEVWKDFYASVKQILKIRVW